MQRYRLYQPVRPAPYIMGLLASLIAGASVYVYMSMADTTPPAPDVYEIEGAEISPYQRIKEAEARMAKRIQAAYDQGRRDCRK